MKTSELIEALAAGAGPAPALPLARRLAPALALGIAGAVAVLLVWLGINPLREFMETRAFWMKAGYTLSLTAGGLMLVAALSRPGGASRWAPLVIGAAVTFVFGMGAMQLARTPAEARMGVWMGHTAMICPVRIAAMAAPVFAALVWGMRRLAPTRLAAAGAAAGLLAGAVGATVYELFCRETGAAFVATWYTLGVAGCALIGAALGRRLLRW